MNTSIIAFFATLALATAAPSGLGLDLGFGGLGGLGVVGIGGLGLAAPGAVLTAPSASAIISGPVARGALLGLPAAGAIIGAPGIIAAPEIIAAPAAVALTPGGGAVSVSGAGAVVSGPKTAPVVIEGPSGKVTASGLWGPTLAGVAVPAGHGW